MKLMTLRPSHWLWSPTGKGIPAADETPHTLTHRFDTLGIQSTEKSRRTYREMLFTAGAADFISGVILQDETIRQDNFDSTPLARVLSQQGILPGIKVDTRRQAARSALPAETVTEGLDGCADRLVRVPAKWGLASRNGVW